MARLAMARLAVARLAVARMAMARTRRSTTGSTGGAILGSGGVSLPPLQHRRNSLTTSVGTLLQCAPTARPMVKRGAKIQAFGRSRGGSTTKIHALTDGCGQTVAFTLSPGNHADISEARELLDKYPAPSRLLAVNGDDANSLRDRLLATETKAVTPSTRSRKAPIPNDAQAYKDRNRIERAFCRLKDWRRIATRYDKLAINFASAVGIAAVGIWWA